MVFQKGEKLRLGCKHSIEARAKMSKSRMGRIISPEWRKKLSDAQKGIPKKPLTESAKEKLRQARRKQVFSPEARKKMTDALEAYRKEHVRDKHWNWKGGITPKNELIRKSQEYKLWRKAVFERDNYTCVWCKAKNGEGKAVFLQADHIKPFAFYPELRFAIDNGRTLCVPCHKTTDTYGVH
jgi:hypothetical protein